MKLSPSTINILRDARRIAREPNQAKHDVLAAKLVSRSTETPQEKEALDFVESRSFPVKPRSKRSYYICYSDETGAVAETHLHRWLAAHRNGFRVLVPAIRATRAGEALAIYDRRFVVAAI